MRYLDTALSWIEDADRVGIMLMRLAIAIVFLWIGVLWIGALKFAPYEADSITPFVVNNPVIFTGAGLAFLTQFVTLSSLVTTPEAWVPAIGDAQHGFPYLSGAGRLVLKDVMLLAGGLLIMADSARPIRRSHVNMSPMHMSSAAYPTLDRIHN